MIHILNMADYFSKLESGKFYDFDSNYYWQPGEHVGALVTTFQQIRYLPLPNAVPDLDQALSGARLDCGKDLHKQLIEYGGAT